MITDEPLMNMGFWSYLAPADQLIGMKGQKTAIGIVLQSLLLYKQETGGRYI
jgi:hypothetical protein